MKGTLNNSQIEYVLYHLNFHFEISEELKSCFKFIKLNSEHKIEKGKVYFSLSEKSLHDDNIIRIRDIPVPFSRSKSNEIFSWENESIVFNHDFLKAAFYLLSGYQETQNSKRDQFNRYPFHGSFQEKYGVISKPLVNYYFQFIEEGIASFCDVTGISFRKNRMFSDFGFILSHDVDFIDTYTFRDVLYRIKILFIRRLSRSSFVNDIKYAFHYFFQYLKFYRRPNPHWDFDYLVGEAKKRNFKSVFYFLHKDLRHHDSYYKFSDPRIKNLFRFLNSRGCEIGLHGSVRSASEFEVMKAHKEELVKQSGQPVEGVRQHRLIHLGHETRSVQEKAGFTYDATLGFAEHEGFRNSFCFPFRMYDFEKDRMTVIWHIPLIVMDATLYMYRKLNPDQARTSVFKLIDECRKFNGLFTLLWHNGNFDKEKYPEGKALFESILDKLESCNTQSLTGIECIAQYIVKVLPSK